MSELDTLVSSPVHKIKDRHGQWHTLVTPDLLDLSVLEKRHGSVFISELSTDVIATLMWICLRREGRSKEQIEQEDWAYSYSEAAGLFSANEYIPLILVCKEVLYAAGIWDRPSPEKADPTVAGDAPAVATENSKPEPGVEPLPS